MSLLLNLVFPGAGSLHGGRVGEGTIQLLLFLVGLATAVFLIGLIIIPGVWAWSLVTSVQILQAARGRKAPPSAPRTVY